MSAVKNFSHSDTEVSTMKEFEEPSMTIRIAAHSVSEEHLFIDTMHCPVCSGGPCKKAMHAFPCYWFVKCKSCDSIIEIVSDTSLIMTDQYWQFLCSGNLKSASRYQRRYNRTNESSKIIDLAQWISHFTCLQSKMNELAVRGERSSVNFISLEFYFVQCLQEALKFYKADEEYPPRSAFFSEETYKHYLTDRSLFSRNHILSILSEQRSLETIEEDLKRFEEMKEN